MLSGGHGWWTPGGLWESRGSRDYATEPGRKG
jgi:hypothetical protein